MIEVFKTNVDSREAAEELVLRIEQQFAGHIANFDLQDSDRILRVRSATGPVQAETLKVVLKEWGYEAIVLPG